MSKRQFLRIWKELFRKLREAQCKDDPHEADCIAASGANDERNGEMIWTRYHKSLSVLTPEQYRVELARNIAICSSIQVRGLKL